MKPGSPGWWAGVAKGPVMYGTCYLCHRPHMALLWSRIPSRAAQVGCCVDRVQCQIAESLHLAVPETESDNDPS